MFQSLHRRSAAVTPASGCAQNTNLLAPEVLSRPNGRTILHLHHYAMASFNLAARLLFVVAVWLSAASSELEQEQEVAGASACHPAMQAAACGPWLKNGQHYLMIHWTLLHLELAVDFPAHDLLSTLQGRLKGLKGSRNPISDNIERLLHVLNWPKIGVLYQLDLLPGSEREARHGHVHSLV